MKNTKWFGLLVSVVLPLVSTQAQAPVSQGPDSSPGQSAAAPVDLSPGVSEAIRLAESGVGDDVVVAYIQNSQATFNLSADHVLYLKDLGLSSAVVTAMLNHDSGFRTQTQPYPPATQPPPQPEVAPQPVEAPPPTYVTTPPPEVNYFYGDLSPYGTWVELAGVGWCWQPRAVVINRGWRPYCDGGHWINSDCGWFWQSDYSWGWAPFHYGRWQLHERNGWVWLPDRVWGPAWVTWRTAGDNCGWAPLPPRAIFDARLGWRFNGVTVGVNFDFGLRPDHFTFVSLHNFTDRDLGRRRLPETEVRNVYNRTTVINNYSVRNTTIVNRGIPIERVAAATHTQIRTVTVRDAPRDARVGGRTQTFDRSGTVVYRHEPSAPARMAPVAVQKVDDRHPMIQHAPITVSQGRSSAYNRGSGSIAAPNRSQPENSRTPQRPGNDGQRNYSQPQPAPRSYQSAPPTRSPEPQPVQRPSQSQSESSPRASRSQQPIRTTEAPAANPSSRASTRSVEEPTHITRSAPPSRPETAYSSAAPVTRAPSRPVQTDSRDQNSHVYYPKTYHQSSEVRSAPQSERRQTAPASSADSGRDSRSRNDRP
ncbi:MAG: hypothetical protein QOJ40_1913 [Verrucomicrobiota bacterium]